MRTLSSYRLTLPLLAALVLLATTAISAWAQSEAGSIELVAIDTDITGNTPTTVGDVQVCSELAVGETRDVDVVVKGIPPASGDGGGMEGFQFTILYDERYIKVTAVDVDAQLIGADPGSNIIDFNDAVPSEDGTMVIAAADFATGTEESGDGVLARLTVEGVGAGTSDFVFLGDAIVNDVGSPDRTYEFDALNGGLLAVGVPCDPNATPPPSPLPTGGPPTGVPPEGSPGPTSSGGEESPGSTDNASGSGGPASGSSGSGSATATPRAGTTEDDDGGGSSAGIIIAIVAVIVVLGGGGAYFFMRRRETPST